MKLKSIVCAAVAAFMALGSCAQKQTNEMNNDNNDSKVLVAYFSATGNTARAAKELAEVMDGTLYEIKPEQPYTEADLNWRDSTSRSSVEMRDHASRPAISGKVADMKKYNTVFLGFPVWWYLAPTIINSFVENNDLKGKTVVCFATSGGSPIRPCVEALREQYPDINWAEGRLLNTYTKSDLEQWKKELGL